MEYVRVKSVENLRKLLSEDRHDYVLSLNSQVFSRKEIYPAGSRFEVFNFVDESRQILNEDQLYSRSNIGKAMDNGAFFCIL